MPIRQLQVANDSVEDRLVLRVGTENNEEFRIFFTRCFLREIWPHLTAMLSGHLASKLVQHSSPPSLGEPSSFELPFIDDNPSYPLGASPLLATEAVLEAGAEGIARLTLREGRERSYSLEINAQLLQALCSMLRAAADQAQWDLTLDYDSPTPVINAPFSAFLH
ncbi:MAG: hypothetical protein D3M94_12530 [Rhodocyclales bacterium GT-UBC]|nr:MAG: hypothetical protein D3M94_12530 [Rhodocyclales bacterium GT-UBC]